MKEEELTVEEATSASLKADVNALQLFAHAQSMTDLRRVWRGGGERGVV